MGNIMFGIKLGKDWTQSAQRSQWKMEEEVAWFWGCFCSRSWAYYTATWQNLRTCLSEPPSATCGSFTASISQSARNFYARQCPLSHCKTGKAVPWKWEHWNNEMASPESDLNPIENLCKIIGDKVMAKKPTTVTELWKRLGEEWTDHSGAVWVSSDVLWPQMCWAHSKQGPLYFLLIFDCCKHHILVVMFFLCCIGYCSLILITVFLTK